MGEYESEQDKASRATTGRDKAFGVELYVGGHLRWLGEGWKRTGGDDGDGSPRPVTICDPGNALRPLTWDDRDEAVAHLTSRKVAHGGWWIARYTGPHRYPFYRVVRRVGEYSTTLVFFSGTEVEGIARPKPKPCGDIRMPNDEARTFLRTLRFMPDVEVDEA